MTRANTAVPLSLFPLCGVIGGQGEGNEEIEGEVLGGGEESYFQHISYKPILEDRSFLFNGPVLFGVRENIKSKQL
jgi:hypothetical protein